MLGPQVMNVLHGAAPCSSLKGPLWHPARQTASAWHMWGDPAVLLGVPQSERPLHTSFYPFFLRAMCLKANRQHIYGRGPQSSKYEPNNLYESIRDQFPLHQGEEPDIKGQRPEYGHEQGAGNTGCVPFGDFFFPSPRKVGESLAADFLRSRPIRCRSYYLHWLNNLSAKLVDCLRQDWLNYSSGINYPRYLALLSVCEGFLKQFWFCECIRYS